MRSVAENEIGASRWTKLDAYLKAHGVKPAHLARESGYSRQHLLRIRLGKMQPSSRCAAAIVVALSRMTGEAVTLRHLFDRELVRRLERDARAIVGSPRRS